MSRFLNFSIKRCNSATSKVPCVDFGPNDEKLIEYLSKYDLALFSADSFLYYDEVDPFIGPVKYSVTLLDFLHGK